MRIRIHFFLFVWYNEFAGENIMRNMKYYLGKHKGVLTLYILIMILQCGFGALSTIFSARFLSIITTFEFQSCIKYLIIASSMLMGNYLCWWSGGYIYSKFSNIICHEIATDLTKRGFELSSSCYSENNAGGFVNRIMEDPLNVLEQMGDLVTTFVELLMSLIVVIYMLTLNWLIGVLYTIVLLILFLLEMKRRKISGNNLKEAKKVKDETDSVINEIIKSQKDIKTLSIEKELSNVSSKRLNKLKKANLKHDIVDNNFWNIRNILLNIFTTAILILGVYLVNKEYITVALLILVYTYREDVYGLIWNVGNVAKNLIQAKISCDRMFNLYNEELYQSEKFGDKSILNMNGTIEFKDVSFAYRELEEIEEKNKKGKKKTKFKHIKKDPVFEKLSFKIQENTTVAFVGKSGCGKSTIVELISKLLDADKGKVLIDGIDIQKLSKSTLRNNISVINQFPYIFDMSIKENLLLIKPDASEQEIWDVLSKVSLDDDIRKMPQKLNSRLGETGVKLSGGQRQRLAIARALLKNSKILIFDESTSSLDNFTQRKIQETIDELKGQQTVIIVAHRLSTIKNVDKIYFMKDGKIEDEGSFDKLFKGNKEFNQMFLMESFNANE